MAKLRKHEPGHPVRFTNPTTGQKVEGHIVDEVWPVSPEEFSETAPDSEGWREAAFVAQLVDWGADNRRVRFTYYVRSGGEGANSWRFAGQYAPSMSLDEFRVLLRKLSEKTW
jgi:hypothetical protein